MLMFTLAISCLTTFNLPWLMDPTFQVPVQYCSLGHWTILSPPDTSTTGCCFHFGSPSSLFLELYLCSPLVAYQASTDLVGGGGSPFFVISFCLSCCSWGSQGKNTEVVCHSLLQRTTFCQSPPPWPTCLGWPYTAWLIIPLNYTRLWSKCSLWLVVCECGFHFGGDWIAVFVSVCPLLDDDKIL